MVELLMNKELETMWKEVMVVASLKMLSWHLPDATEENLSGQLASGQRFEPGTCRIPIKKSRPRCSIRSGGNEKQGRSNKILINYITLHKILIQRKLVDREKDNININLRETAHKDVNYRIQYTGR
jgi:hypothetical protein